MNTKIFKHKKYFASKKQGYAILFAVIMVSVISTIALGLSNTVYKQLIINSVAKDSQTAFYESDIATECGLYLDQKSGKLPVTVATPWNCGLASDGTNVLLSITKNANGTFDVTSTNPATSSTLPCFDINVDKTSATFTTIKANGYNICKQSNFRTVERSIQVSY